MRRRKSSCPNIEPPRRASATPNRNTVKLDLYIEDDELHPGPPGRRSSPSPTLADHISGNQRQENRRRSSTNIEDTAEEVLCLRLLSTRTRYRFGGLRVHVVSPVFNVSKLFNVEFDQDSQISLIKSQQSSYDDTPTTNRHSTETGPQYNNSLFDDGGGGGGVGGDEGADRPRPPTRHGKCATILVSPEEEIDEITRQLPILTADLTLLEDCSNRNASNSTVVTPHKSARSLTRIPEPDKTDELSTLSPIKRTGKRHTLSTSSINSDNNNQQQSSSSSNVKFDSVKVYTHLGHRPSSDDGQEPTGGRSPGHSSSSKKSNNDGSQKKKGSKFSAMRRHTHWHFQLPASLTSGGGSSSASSGPSAGSASSGAKQI